MLQPSGRTGRDRPWRLRLCRCRRSTEGDRDGRLLRRCCPPATVHRWCCVLVRPRRSDCVVLALGLLCFVSSLSLETALLLRYEEHVMLVVASLVVGALLLASCCMGALVWWKGPQWADDDRDASAWVHERRPVTLSVTHTRECARARARPHPTHPPLSLVRAFSYTFAFDDAFAGAARRPSAAPDGRRGL